MRHVIIHSSTIFGSKFSRTSLLSAALCVNEGAAATGLMGQLAQFENDISSIWRKEEIWFLIDYCVTAVDFFFKISRQLWLTCLMEIFAALAVLNATHDFACMPQGFENRTFGLMWHTGSCQPFSQNQLLLLPWWVAQLLETPNYQKKERRNHTIGIKLSAQK